MKSITPSLARDSFASDSFAPDPLPATTVTRAAPKVVSVHNKGSHASASSSAAATAVRIGSHASASTTQSKGLQIVLAGESPASPASASHYAKARQVVLGNKPVVSSPLSPDPSPLHHSTTPTASSSPFADAAAAAASPALPTDTASPAAATPPAPPEPTPNAPDAPAPPEPTPDPPAPAQRKESPFDDEHRIA